MRSLWLVIALAILFSCGIKTNTKPLEYPVVELRRIGNRVYLRSLQGEVVPEGFTKVEDYWIRDEAGSFCFVVKRTEGKKKRQCVGGLTDQKVSLKVEYDQKRAKVHLEGFDLYQLYPLDGDRIDPWSGRQVAGVLELKREYIQRCYLVVGKKKEDYSMPTEFCLEAMPHPKIRDVERLEYRVWKDKLYLLWSYEPDELFKEFVIFENDREIGTTKAYIFEVSRKEEEIIYKVKVRSIYGKESEGVSLSYSP